MTQPAAPKTCPLCREPIADDAPSGGCPKCLLGAGVPTGGRAAEADGLGAADVAAMFPDYEILGFLGRGGMGVVWKARHRGLDRVVALKVLPHDVARAAGFSERFQREARALARLSHPNIVGVHEYGEREGTYFLVMEFVDGVNMRQALREGRIGPRDVLRVVPQICDALQYAHDHGVVHRDIKPENILVCTSSASARGDVAEPQRPGTQQAPATGGGNVLIAADGRVKVADFGLAKIVGGDTAVDLTLPGQVMGTPAYMAPEQVERPTSVDHRADIYSLGVVFYEMLTGELPLGRFEAPSKRVQVDVRFDEVVLRSLEKQPERRWQHAADVKTEVGAIAAAPVAAPVAARTQSPRTNRLAVVSLCLALAAVPVAFVGAAAFGRTNVWVGLPVALGGALLLSAFAGGVVSWVQIARSKGAERGLGYAITATILSLVLPCLALPLSFLAVSREVVTADRSSRGTRSPDTEPAATALVYLQSRVSGDRSPSALVPLYARQDQVTLLRALEDRSADPARLADLRGLGGLPMLVWGWSPDRVMRLRVIAQESTDDPDHLRVTAVELSGDLAYEFDLVVEDGEPKFRATPVVVRSKHGISVK